MAKKRQLISAKSGPAWPGNTLENQLRASLWLIEEQRKAEWSGLVGENDVEPVEEPS